MSDSTPEAPDSSLDDELGGSYQPSPPPPFSHLLGKEPEKISNDDLLDMLGSGLKPTAPQDVSGAKPEAVSAPTPAAPPSPPPEPAIAAEAPKVVAPIPEPPKLFSAPPAIPTALPAASAEPKAATIPSEPPKVISMPPSAPFDSSAKPAEQAPVPETPQGVGREPSPIPPAPMSGVEPPRVAVPAPEPPKTILPPMAPTPFPVTTVAGPPKPIAPPERVTIELDAVKQSPPGFPDPVASTPPVEKTPSGPADPLGLFQSPGTVPPKPAPAGLEAKASAADPLGLFSGSSATRKTPESAGPVSLPASLQPPALSTGVSSAQKNAADPFEMLGAKPGLSGAGVLGAMGLGGSKGPPKAPSGKTTAQGLDALGPIAARPPMFPATSKRIPKISALEKPVPARKPNPLRAMTRQFLGPAASHLRVPLWLLELFMVLLLTTAVVGSYWAAKGTGYKLVDSVTPLHMVRMEVTQMVELDITAYLELESKLAKLGFNPLIKVGVIEIPSPNLFSVYLKPDTNSYGVILKVPGSNTPRISFLSFLSNEMWLSTNGWASQNQELEKISSQSFPGLAPEALWKQHLTRMNHYMQAGVGLQRANAYRFLSALSDHLRWFIEIREIQPFKARFEDWF